MGIGYIKVYKVDMSGLFPVFFLMDIDALSGVVMEIQPRNIHRTGVLLAIEGLI